MICYQIKDKIMAMQLLYVTTNRKKVSEIQQFITQSGADIELLPEPLELTEIQSLDQQAIALDKAQQAFHVFKRPLIIDDAGIFFERYNQFPGTLSKFVMEGMGFEGVKRLFDEGDRARFQLTLVYVNEQGEPFCFEGTTEGTLVKPAQMADPDYKLFNEYFVPDNQPGGGKKTVAQLKEAGGSFYRIDAFKKFLQWFSENKE